MAKTDYATDLNKLRPNLTICDKQKKRLPDTISNSLKNPYIIFRPISFANTLQHPKYVRNIFAILIN